MQPMVTGPEVRQTAGGEPAVSRKCLALGNTALSSSEGEGGHHLLGLAITGRY